MLRPAMHILKRNRPTPHTACNPAKPLAQSRALPLARCSAPAEVARPPLHRSFGLPTVLLRLGP
eukprot:7384346-Prymnesium_polylepis.1